MLSILRTQQTEINQLRSEIQNQQRQQNQQVTEVLREEVAVLECAVSSKMETVLAEHAREQGNFLKI